MISGAIKFLSGNAEVGATFNSTVQTFSQEQQANIQAALNLQ